MIVLVASLITAAVALAVTYGASKHIFTKTELTEAYKFAVWAASAAEEMFAAGNGATKYEYVHDLIKTRFGVSDEEARMLVNAAVNGLRSAGVKVPAPAPLKLVPPPTTPPVTPAAA